MACGGFSYGDTLGAGIGWARSITLQPARWPSSSRPSFSATTPSRLGVCNGCQMLAELADIIPGAQDWPRFTTNQSERFEARLSLVEVLESARACSSRAWPAAACRLRWRTAKALPTSPPRRCGQGVHRAMRFVDNTGQATEAYPFNPNGSPGGLTAVTTADGRFTAMMPHPERVFRNVQMSWTSGERSARSPWMRMFGNARGWVG